MMTISEFNKKMMQLIARKSARRAEFEVDSPDVCWASWFDLFQCSIVCKFNMSGTYVLSKCIGLSKLLCFLSLQDNWAKVYFSFILHFPTNKTRMKWSLSSITFKAACVWFTIFVSFVHLCKSSRYWYSLQIVACIF